MIARIAPFVACLIAQVAWMSPCHGQAGHTVAEAERLNGDTPAMEQAINQQLIRWSQEWQADRYVPDSAKLTEQAAQGSLITAQGQFVINRFGIPHTIALAASIVAKDSGMLVTRLCYSDPSSRSSDCFAGVDSPDAAPSESASTSQSAPSSVQTVSGTAATPDPFEDDMVSFVNYGNKTNQAGDSRFIRLADLIFLPDIGDLHAIIDFAAQRIRSNPAMRARFVQLDASADKLIADIKADSVGSASLLYIQKSRAALAADGAKAAAGDAAAAARLNQLAGPATTTGVGPKAIELVLAFRGLGDEQDRAFMHGDNDAGRAGAAMSLGIFTLRDAKISVNQHQAQVATVIISAVGPALLCDQKHQQEQANWEARNCRRTIVGRNPDGTDIWGLDCDGKTFHGSECAHLVPSP